jgi:O-antigen ligase
VLAIGLFSATAETGKRKRLRVFLWVAIGIMGLGLICSYSRGSWLSTAVGLLYLAWCYGKVNWRRVLLVVAAAAVLVFVLHGSTSDTAPWYVKRTDLGRASAQNRFTAWLAGFEIMRDHPFGVGWGNALRIYQERYSPPEGGPGALITNAYLMLGTQLGIPALLCFMVYVGLCFSGNCVLSNEGAKIRVACRTGAIILLVAFWFDSGLFTLPISALFWVLLELGKKDLAVTMAA